jgi:hypothetical protein
MDTTMDTKTALVESIRKARAEWEALLAEVGEARMIQPGATGGWTFKDVIAHLSAWRQRDLVLLEAARRGEKPADPPWPEGLDTDQINAWIYERNRDRPLEDVLMESRATWQQVEDGVLALPEEALFDPARFEWMEGEPLGPTVVGGCLDHYYKEHAPILRAWLQQQES